MTEHSTRQTSDTATQNEYEHEIELIASRHEIQLVCHVAEPDDSHKQKVPPTTPRITNPLKHSPTSTPSNTACSAEPHSKQKAKR